MPRPIEGVSGNSAGQQGQKIEGQKGTWKARLVASKVGPEVAAAAEKMPRAGKVGPPEDGNLSVEIPPTPTSSRIVRPRSASRSSLSSEGSPSPTASPKISGSPSLSARWKAKAKAELKEWKQELSELPGDFVALTNKAKDRVGDNLSDLQGGLGGIKDKVQEKVDQVKADSEQRKLENTKKEIDGMDVGKLRDVDKRLKELKSDPELLGHWLAKVASTSPTAGFSNEDLMKITQAIEQWPTEKRRENIKLLAKELGIEPTSGVNLIIWLETAYENSVVNKTLGQMVQANPVILGHWLGSRVSGSAESTAENPFNLSEENLAKMTSIIEGWPEDKKLENIGLITEALGAGSRERTSTQNDHLIQWLEGSCMGNPDSAFSIEGPNKIIMQALQTWEHVDTTCKRVQEEVQDNNMDAGIDANRKRIVWTERVDKSTPIAFEKHGDVIMVERRKGGETFLKEGFKGVTEKLLLQELEQRIQQHEALFASNERAVEKLKEEKLELNINQITMQSDLDKITRLQESIQSKKSIFKRAAVASQKKELHAHLTEMRAQVQKELNAVSKESNVRLAKLTDVKAEYEEYAQKKMDIDKETDLTPKEKIEKLQALEQEHDQALAAIHKKNAAASEAIAAELLPTIEYLQQMTKLIDKALLKPGDTATQDVIQKLQARKDALEKQEKEIPSRIKELREKGAASINAKHPLNEPILDALDEILELAVELDKEFNPEKMTELKQNINALFMYKEKEIIDYAIAGQDINDELRALKREKTKLLDYVNQMEQFAPHREKIVRLEQEIAKIKEDRIEILNKEIKAIQGDKEEGALAKQEKEQIGLLKEKIEQGGLTEEEEQRIADLQEKMEETEDEALFGEAGKDVIFFMTRYDKDFSVLKKTIETLSQDSRYLQGSLSTKMVGSNVRGIEIIGNDPEAVNPAKEQLELMKLEIVNKIAVLEKVKVKLSEEGVDQNVDQIIIGLKSKMEKINNILKQGTVKGLETDGSGITTKDRRRLGLKDFYPVFESATPYLSRSTRQAVMVCSIYEDVVRENTLLEFLREGESSTSLAAQVELSQYYQRQHRTLETSIRALEGVAQEKSEAGKSAREKIKDLMEEMKNNDDKMVKANLRVTALKQALVDWNRAADRSSKIAILDRLREGLYNEEAMDRVKLPAGSGEPSEADEQLISERLSKELGQFYGQYRRDWEALVSNLPAAAATPSLVNPVRKPSRSSESPKLTKRFKKTPKSSS